MDIHIMAVVLKQSPENIDNQAVELFQEYGVGRTTNGAKGVLFLEKGNRGWMMDFASMTKLIGFNHKNQWHLRQ